ncbi:aspartyl/asparaginyl beta-hydroxylase domain-containing protein [Streptomyces sp. NPDC020807]|uniref:aspartyl/asparaginyl beta-hydroxylase domain-containing protein n=1 Tax=Streptomyces sp. NPDC020807 TaxID=3155119 RepID=UPI0033DD5C1C
MASVILSRIPFDEERLVKDVARLATLPAPQEPYEVFTTGTWLNLNLWNATGDHSDGFWYGHEQRPGQATALLDEVPYLREVITSWFNLDRLTMVRGRNVSQFSIIPHRDFIEAGHVTEFFRVLIFLEDNEHTVNSDEDMVFHVRKGEVWYLDAAQVHAGMNMSTRSRWSLCLDFAAGPGFEPGDIFARPEFHQPDLEPELVVRRPADPGLPERLRALSGVVSRHNIKDIAFLLGRIHFTEEVPIASSWDWLLDITRENGDPELIAIAERAKKFFVLSREVGEDFRFLPG